MLQIIFHVATLVIVPPIFLGIINKVKAIAAGRRGPPIFQLYYDLAKLFRKGMVLSETTTWIFVAGPIIAFISTVIAGMVVPLGARTAPIQFAGDFILFAYLFGLGRYFTTTAALDTGSAFEGMGAAREVTFATLAEPILFCCFIALTKLSSSLSLSQMIIGSSASILPAASAAVLLIAVAMCVVMLVENSRVPFDDPNTHLELTMIHEVMVLDHSGPLFGLILYGASIKLFIMNSLIAGLLLPSIDGGGPLDWSLLLVGVLILSMGIGIIESSMARLKLPAVPKLLVGAAILSGFAVVLVFR